MAQTSQTGRKISHFQVEELIGCGGVGEVYRAMDLSLGRPVALKFLQPLLDKSLRQQLIREAQSASSLDHPNICTIYEVDETDEGEIFIAMAYYEGESIDKIISRGPLEIDRAIGIAIQMGRGLMAAHEELIIHRDIKAANTMVTVDDTVKILDFGLARTLEETLGSNDGSVVGTPAYMSPEQLRGQPVDQRTDIWSLGVVLYQMLTGRLPFEGENIRETIDSVLRDQPARVSTLREGIPPQIDNILERALAKNVRHRYERIDEMVQDLLYIQTIMDTNAITLRLPAALSKTSIAVLPFEDMSPNRDQEYLCDGIAEEILRALSLIPDLYVASRTSSFQFRHHLADIREIGARLNVDHILEGSVRLAGDRVRISAQLISVANGYRLWYERYDREMKDIFSIEDEIAERIAEALEVTLTGAARHPAAVHSSTDAEAYQLYLQGRKFFHQHRRKAFEIALQIFSQVKEIDPEYARAYAGIADCHSFLSLYFGHGTESVNAADAASRQALELDPGLADAYSSRGLALFLLKKFDESEEHLRRAIELDPNLYDAHYIFGRVCFSQGKIREAAKHFRDACTIVPEAYDSWYLLGMCYRRLGESAKARSSDLECIEAVNKRIRMHPDDTRAVTMGASVLATMGEPDRALEWVGRALAIDADEPIIAYNAACVYTELGKYDQAIECLKTSTGQGGISADWVRNDPDMDPLRNDPRFNELISRTGE